MSFVVHGLNKGKVVHKPVAKFDFTFSGNQIVCIDESTPALKNPSPIVEWVWELIDNSDVVVNQHIITTPGPGDHTFVVNTTGLYKIRLTVTDQSGRESEPTQSDGFGVDIIISDITPPPIPTMPANALSVVGNDIEMIINTQPDPDSDLQYVVGILSTTNPPTIANAIRNVQMPEVTAKGTTPVFVFTGPFSPGTYYGTAYAVDLVGNPADPSSYYATPQSVVISSGSLPQPVSFDALTAQALTHYRIDVSWNASTNATGYFVKYRLSGAGAFTYANTVPVVGTTFSFTSAVELQSYDFQIEAINTDWPQGTGTLSNNIVSATTPAAPVGGTGLIAGQDFTLMNSLADLNSAFSIQTAGNILFDDGTFIEAHTGLPSGNRGLLYRFMPAPTKCNDQSLVTYCSFLNSKRAEIWIEAVIIFSTNWTTANANCYGGSGGEDYKTILAYPMPAMNTTGGARSELKVGTKLRKIHVSGTGFPGDDAAPLSVVQTSAVVDATTLWDGQPHTYRLHFTLENENGINKEVMQCMIDGQVTHSLKDFGNPDRVNEIFGRIKVGANRNLGATEEMYVWWQQFYVYDVDPGWFTGVPITNYAP